MIEPAQGQPEAYWERAGELGYAEAMYSSQSVAQHVTERMAGVALEVAREIGIPAGGHVIELGCGDGYFSNNYLARRYGRVEAYDLSAAAIARAQAVAPDHVHFAAADILGLELPERVNGLFLMGILHHVKAGTPALVRRLARVAPRVVVLEPNGNHALRKLLELTPSYRAAGEESFRRRELVRIFAEAGYQDVVNRRLNLFPNFTPGFVFRACSRLEPLVERSRVLNALCTVNMFGFRLR